MKRLEGLYLVYYTPPPNADREAVTQRLIEAIQDFNAKHGLMPRILGVSEHTQEGLRQALAEAGERLRLEVVTAAHIEARTFWLGPVERVPEAA